MKKNLFLLLALVLTFFNSSFAQVAPGFDIFTLPSRFDVQSETYFKNNGFVATGLEVQTHGSIYSSDKYNYDPVIVKRYLDKYFPGTYNTGMVLLDWEVGPYHQVRDYPATDSRFKRGESEMIALINEVRRLRPKMKVGYYSIPFRGVNDWQMDNYNTPGKLDKIISNVDFIVPSTYILYTDEERGHQWNVDYIKLNLKPALILGKKHGKPVYPAFWHRVHYNNKTYGHEIIQKEVLAKYVKLIKDYSYNNYKSAGAFWWDDVSGRLDDLGGINGHLKGTVYNATTYDAMIVNYGKYIKQVLNNGSTTSEPAPAPITSPQVESYTLIDASTKKELMTLANGATINLGSLSTNKFNIRANAKGDVGSVKFYLSGTQTKSVTESMVPYDIMGDNGAWTPSTGSYTLKATPYTGAKATGTAGTALSVSFTVVSSSSSSSTTGSNGESFTLINADTEKDIMTIANGATVNLGNLPTMNVNIRFNKGSQSMASVKLVLTGTQTKSVVESIAPYALIGDNNNGNYYSWTPPTGSYTLKATPYSGSEATGTAGATYSISFKVTNSYSASSSSSLSIDSTSLSFEANNGVVAYPNPATTLLNVEASDTGEGEATIKFYDLNGRVVLTQEEKVSASGLKTVVDISNLRQGLYILEVITPKGRTSQRIIKE
jgi:hypothetical protein